MGTKPKMKIVYFSRKPRALGNFSIETYFKLIRENLGEEFEAVNCEAPFENNGLFKRLGNAIYCAFKQGDVNHITGDVHYLATFLKKRKTILTILDCGMLHELTGLKHKIFKLFWFEIPFKKVKIITAISTATKNDIIKLTACPEEKIKVIYVAISNIFSRCEKIFNTAEPRILQIGTAHNKNLERLIPALNGINCKLVIIGKIDGPTVLLLQQNQIKYELFDRRLSEDEVVEEYKKCDILAFVSTLEGFGMPIIEANTVGRIVITGNISSMPEISGDAACLVDPFSVEAILIGLKKVINDKEYRDELIENGFKNAQRFTIKTLADEYAAIYKSLKKLT
jgi:glycosyltransferase involved in cell wall biosynthesis